MDYIIQTDSLTKSFGNKAAVDKVSLHVGKGEIYGLIGKNGAGKTTLMKLLLGLSNPNSGEIKLYGGSDLNKARRTIGSLIEEPALYKNETALENLRRFAILVPTPDEDLQKLLELVGLGNVGNKKAGRFSLGMRQRLGLAIALLGNPDIMILDEPINGLDPAGIKEIRDIILELNQKGVTFLISSHLLDELGSCFPIWETFTEEAVEDGTRSVTSLEVVFDIKSFKDIIGVTNWDVGRVGVVWSLALWSSSDDVWILFDIVLCEAI